MIATAAVLTLFSGIALASAMLATTRACEILTEAELNRAAGHTMQSQGGTADIAHITECFWWSETGPSLEFRLMAEELFSPSGQTGLDYLTHNIDVMKKSGGPFELIPGIGDGAMLTEAPDTLFIDLAAGGDYLSIRLTGGTRATVIAIAEAAAKKMAD